MTNLVCQKWILTLVLLVDLFSLVGICGEREKGGGGRSEGEGGVKGGEEEGRRIRARGNQGKIARSDITNLKVL